MPYPATGTERARPDLADTLFEWDHAANMANFVWSQVCPIRTVPIFKGDFGRVLAKDMMARGQAGSTAPPGFEYARAPRAAYPTEDTKFTKDEWRTQEHGLEGFVDDWERDAYRSYFDQEAFTTAQVQARLNEATERRVANLFFDAVTFAPGANQGLDITTVPTEAWDVYATATPVKHIRDARFAIYDNSGIWADTVVFNQFAWEHIIETDDVRSRVHSQGSGSADRQQLITQQIVGQILGVQVIVAGGTYDANNPNQAFAPAQIWGPHAMIFKRAMSDNLREITLARTFHWAADNSMPLGHVEDYREPQRRAHKIRVRTDQQNRLIYENVGYLLQNIYTP